MHHFSILCCYSTFAAKMPSLSILLIHTFMCVLVCACVWSNACLVQCLVQQFQMWFTKDKQSKLMRPLLLRGLFKIWKKLLLHCHFLNCLFWFWYVLASFIGNRVMVILLLLLLLQHYTVCHLLKSLQQSQYLVLNRLQKWRLSHHKVPTALFQTS